MIKNCEICGVEFETKLKNKVICGDDRCVYDRHYNKKIERLNKKNGTNKLLRSRLITDLKIKEEKQVIKIDERRKRKCLKCNKEFLSEWSGNRLCAICVEKNTKLYE